MFGKKKTSAKTQASNNIILAMVMLPGENTFNKDVFINDDPFLLTVGIFGGRGQFVLSATPKKIEKIDCGLEFGGYLGINIGIASGFVFLFAGFRYVYLGKKGIYLSGWLICGGGVSVFGFISVTVTFLLMMDYESSTSSMYGTASVSYSIKIAFFKKSFTLTYSKRIAGAERRAASAGNPGAAPSEDYAQLKGPNAGDINVFTNYTPANPKDFASIYSTAEWNKYCESFKF